MREQLFFFNFFVYYFFLMFSFPRQWYSTDVLQQHFCSTCVKKKVIIRHPHDKIKCSVSNKGCICHSVNNSGNKDILSPLYAVKSRHRTTCCCAHAQSNSKRYTVLICQTLWEISRCFLNQPLSACFWSVGDICLCILNRSLSRLLLWHQQVRLNKWKTD